MNKNHRIKIAFWLKMGGVSGLFLSTALHAGIPVWTYSAPNPTSVTVSSGDTATVQYTVTNQSRKSKNLLLKATPGLSASACHLAGKGSTCVLTLTINGNLIPQQGIHAGPLLCQQGNPNQCYQPSPGHVLNVVKSNTPPVTQTNISTTPSSFGFIVGGNDQVVTLTNNGPLDAYDVRITSAPGLGITASSDCPSLLSHVAPNNVCHLTFISGNVTGSTSATIAGSNTNELSEGITVNPVPAPIAIIEGSIITLYTNDVRAVGLMVIKNNSTSITATNIAADFTGTNLAGRVTQNGSTCTSVAPGASCTLQFTVSGTTAVSATNFDISGSNTTKATGNLTISKIPSGLSIGDSLGGGIIVSSNGSPFAPEDCVPTSSTLYLVAARSDADSPNRIDWGGYGITTGATDITNGYTNTQTIVSVLGAGTNYAAGWCSNYQVDENDNTPCQSGVCYDGWYLPAQTELYCLYNNQGNLGLYGIYWSSTEYDANFARTQSSIDGIQYIDGKSNADRARCVRAITN